MAANAKNRLGLKFKLGFYRKLAAPIKIKVHDYARSIFLFGYNKFSVKILTIRIAKRFMGISRFNRLLSVRKSIAVEQDRPHQISPPTLVRGSTNRPGNFQAFALVALCLPRKFLQEHLAPRPAVRLLKTLGVLRQ